MKKFLICGLLVLFAIPVFAICDHTLHVADTEIQLCTTKNTTPSLNVKLGDTVYYANITTEDSPINSMTPRKLKVMYENTVRTIHDNVEYKFFFTPETDENTYSFQISAAGTFYINWGDGNIEKIVKTNINNVKYSHIYADSASNYEIALGGKATNYYDRYNASISFHAVDAHIKSMRGSLGQIFSTIENTDGTLKQPSFLNTFLDNKNLTCSIPDELFDGIYGQPINEMFRYTFSNTGLTGNIPSGLFGAIYGHPAPYMFDSTFYSSSGLTGSIPANLFGHLYGQYEERMFFQTFAKCSGLTGHIPAGLFGNLSGSPAINMFAAVFGNCSGLTGPIPDKLFGTFSGQPAEGMFNNSFYGCRGLSGSIPSDLFAGIYGTPANQMYRTTFLGCSGLTGEIPENLFGNLYGEAKSEMFGGTFYNTTGLTGNSAKINGKYLYEIWPDATPEQVGSCYRNNTNLTDYADIPSAWK